MEDFLRENPELNAFLLSNVKLTSATIGRGSYGVVEEVAIPGAVCAAKKIHGIFLDPNTVRTTEIQNASAQFVKECQLMSTLRHPNIVQFLGICEIPGSRLPALVMERLATCLHDVLDPEIYPPSPADAPKPFFPLNLKCSILQNVASGLACLHDQTPPIIHRDLSARNVLLTTGMVAKIADLGTARITSHMKTAATMTKAPGASVYMPPESLENHPGNKKRGSKDRDLKAKYDSSIDVFSFGVLSIFTLSQTFPCGLLAPTYRLGGRHIARTELERREEYMRMIHDQFGKKHPLVMMIVKCLDFPERRPSVHEVLDFLEQARQEDKDKHAEFNVLQLLQALEMQQTRTYTVSERKDQETAHTTIGDTETQYFHQRRREAISSREDLLHQQRQQMTAQLHQKEEELALAHQQIQKLEEEVLNKTRQFKQYRKEIDQLSSEKATYKQQAESHMAQVTMFKKEIETERKDRESVHTRIADMETRYRHQLESLGEELQKVSDEAKRQRETVAKKDDQLQQQKKQMASQLQNKEESLTSAFQQISALEEEVKQVDQYHKQIDKLNSEVVILKQQAEAYMSQIEFFAKKVEEYEGQKTLTGIHEWKIAELQAKCDKIRAENNEKLMSQSQQLTQYKKQIDHLSLEVATYQQQAEDHKEQIVFYAKKIEECGRQKVFHEKKIAQLEAECRQLQIENELLSKTQQSPSLTSSL